MTMQLGEAISQSLPAGDAGPDRKAALHAELKRRILTCMLPPGGDLDEARLAQEFEISRPPVREVLRQMAGEGFVELRPNRGARVAAMDHTTLRNFYLVAPMIYGAVTRLAARNARPDQIAELRKVQAEFRIAIEEGRVEDRVFLNDRFHALTGEMADNAYLEPSLRRLLIDHARIGMTFYQPRTAAMRANLDVAAAQHDEIIAAIETGDEDRAEALAVAHWELSRSMIEVLARPDGLTARLNL